MRFAKDRRFPRVLRTAYSGYAPGPAAAEPAPAEPPTSSRPPLILAGCFKGLAEEGFLDQAVGDIAGVMRIEGRSQLLMAASLLAPRLVVLPSADAAGISTCSIVSRCLSLGARDGIRVLVLLSLTPGARRTGRTCACPGVEVACARNAAELREVISPLLRPATPQPILRLA